MVGAWKCHPFMFSLMELTCHSKESTPETLAHHLPPVRMMVAAAFAIGLFPPFGYLSLIIPFFFPRKRNFERWNSNQKKKISVL